MPPRHSPFMRFTTHETGTLYQAARDISKKANVLITIDSSNGEGHESARYNKHRTPLAESEKDEVLTIQLTPEKGRRYLATLQGKEIGAGEHLIPLLWDELSQVDQRSIISITYDRDR